MFHAYNLDTYQVIQNPLGPHNLVVSPETDREDGVVYDPISNKYYRVDHYEQVATEEVSLQEPRPSEFVLELCKKLQTALDDYVRLYYIGELVAAVVYGFHWRRLSVVFPRARRRFPSSFPERRRSSAVSGVASGSPTTPWRSTTPPWTYAITGSLDSVGDWLCQDSHPLL